MAAQVASNSSTPLPREIVLSIQRILELQESDPLDALGDFDPVDTLNQLFLDETSLSQIADVQERLHQNELTLRKEIVELEAELQREQNPQKMQAIQEMIGELLSQMFRIREKATESEAIVKHITKDIQFLDLAKKNLSQSMTALKRFQMLVNALSQLEQLVKSKKYAEITQTLAAVKEISAYFNSYRSIEQIARTRRRVLEVQGQLREFMEDDFYKFLFQDPARPMRSSTILDACEVADVMGEDVRKHLIDKYCASELKEYRRIFRVTDEAGQLDNISRRYAWFRRILKSHDEEHSRAFPPSWKVGQHLCAKFLESTREDVVVVLSKAPKAPTVALLLESLQQTLDFQAQLCQKYQTTLSEILQCTTASMRPYQPISAAFEPHMGVYVDAQDKALAEMLAPHRGTKKSRPSLEGAAASSETITQVLPSSTDLFYFYGQNLEQCGKLTTGKPMYELCALYKKWLRLYAEDVLVAGMKGGEATRKSLESSINKTEILNTCLVINTAEYCQVTALELEEKIKEKISPEFRDEVSLQSEIEYFVSVISTAINVLLRELELSCDIFFTHILKTVWSSVEHVSGQSSRLGELLDSIVTVNGLVQDNLQQKKYKRSFCDKAVNVVLARWTNSLVKSRPLKDKGAEQLLMDLQALKACLLKLSEPTTDSAAPTSFTKSVNKSTSRIETLLKAINAPLDPEAFIGNYLVLIGDSSFSNFQKILDLKGAARAEQNELLDKFLTTTSTRDDLESSSFLSSLDMEPSTSILTSIGTPAAPRPVPAAAAAVSTPIGSEVEGSPASILATLGSPPHSRSNTPSSARGDDIQKKGGFGDLRRLLPFGAKRDTANP